MQIRALFPVAIVCALGGSVGYPAPLEPAETIRLWPSQPPGPTRDLGPEHILQGRPRPFYQITDVTTPTLSVFLPSESRRTGAAILVCPGGGLQRLAIEHEGYEVAEWLASLDAAVFLLKYRVPAPVMAGLQDAQRALSLIRARAEDWDVDPEAVGVLGFSAGGEIAAWLATHHQERQYEPVDANDSFNCRPDFAALIYPGGLLQRRAEGIKESISRRLGSNTPPVFLVHSFHDSCEQSLQMALALKRASVPVELHLFQDGGHGFGVRPSGSPLNNWRDQFVEWTRAQGLLDPMHVRTYAKVFAKALPGDGSLPRFSSRHPQATLAEAYAVQDRLVRQVGLDQIAGFKAAALDALNIRPPLTGVLFRRGKLPAQPAPLIHATAAGGRMVETEIGYQISVDISYRVLNDDQARGAVTAIVPVIELPANYGRRMGTMTATDMTAANVGSAQYIVGEPIAPSDADPNALRISLRRDGQVLHDTRGDIASGGQWANLRTIINQLVDRGYTIRAGSLIISGALGLVHPGEPGRYQADFDKLGSIDFELK